MTDATEEIITLADFTTWTDDIDPYGQYVSPDAPDHDPFSDYPDVPPFEGTPAPLFAIPMQVSATLAHNLDVRRQKIWACWGKGVQVGWIGDSAHQQTCTDHNTDAANVVHAIDPMVTGARAKTVVDQCLADRNDLQYVIHNEVIWSASADWKPRKYTGKNPHRDHVHISGKHGSANKSSRTCTGYDLKAQAATPTFDICPKPAPKPPVPKPPVKPSTHAPGTRVLKLVDPQLHGDDVIFVQKFIGAKKCGAADGTYGPKTVSGVRWYQDMRGIHVDGEVGPQTWKQMGVKWRG